MDKNFLQEVKSKMEKEREILKEQLRTFAKEDPKLKGDWDTRFPKLDGATGSARMEDAADAVEEYATNLPIEFSLETKLRDIEIALKKIEKDTYGICEQCGNAINKERLEIHPSARLCMKCKK